MNALRLWPFFLVALPIVQGCGEGTAARTRSDMSYLYSGGDRTLRLVARVHHESNERSVIYFKLHTADLLYKSTGGEGFHSLVELRYEAFPSWNSKELLDSASTLIKDRAEGPDSDQELIGSIPMRRARDRDLVLRITAHDLYREQESSVLLEVKHGPPGGRQYFLPVAPTGGLPLFDDHQPPGTEVRVRCEALAGQTLIAERHLPAYRLPPPVFSANSPSGLANAPDSVFLVKVDADGLLTLNTGSAGFLHVRSDTSTMEGYTLFTLSEAYPYVRQGTDMLAPLRYITSMQEYDNIRQADNVRSQVEAFWLDAFGERDRARQAIRTYYGRVENANRYFTTWIEGWRTDRGMVHIIFGPPNSIHRGTNSETWTYGEASSLMSLNFVFVRREQPFTDNDLVLDRDPTFKGAWYRNVESWRNGRVY